MSDDLPASGTAPDTPWVEVTASPHFAHWLAEQQVSLAFTTYQSGKLFLLGRRPDGVLAVFERTFSRAMGLWADGQTLWLGTQYQLWRFENVLRAPPRDPTRADAAGSAIPCPEPALSLLWSAPPQQPEVHRRPHDDERSAG